MHHIIYLSWATCPPTTGQLQQLLTHARRRNAELAVSGILLYGNECFVQVLEGEQAIVQELYAQIRRDPRHGNFITFVDQPADQRAFTDWAMAFQPVSSQQLDDIVGYLGSPATLVDTARLSYADGHLFDLLRAFVLP